MALEMQQAAKDLNAQRREQTGYKPAAEQVASTGGGQYMREMKRDAYMDSDMNLEQRLNAKSHYRDRNLK